MGSNKDVTLEMASQEYLLPSFQENNPIDGTSIWSSGGRMLHVYNKTKYKMNHDNPQVKCISSLPLSLLSTFGFNTGLFNTTLFRTLSDPYHVRFSFTFPDPRKRTGQFHTHDWKDEERQNSNNTLRELCPTMLNFKEALVPYFS